MQRHITKGIKQPVGSLNMILNPSIKSLIYWISGYWIWISDSFETGRYSCQHSQVSGPWDSPRFFFLGVHLVDHLCKNVGRSWTTLRTDCHMYLNTRLMISPKRPAFFNGLSTTSQRSRKAQALPSSPTLKKNRPSETFCIPSWLPAFFERVFHPPISNFLQLVDQVPPWCGERSRPRGGNLVGDREVQ